MREEGRTHRRGRHLALAGLIALVGCSQGPGTTVSTTSSPGASSPIGEPSPTPTIQDVMEIEGFFAPLEPGTYFIDPDADPSTPLRVVYDVPAEGWSTWLGAAKFGVGGHVGVSITTVTNLVRRGCRNHSPADPPVGSSVDDLATALADLAPFRVTSPPEDVTVYGYGGKHLELTVPDLPVAGDGFAGCVGGDLASWFSPNHDSGDLAFIGYEGPGYTEEFWILDVEGTRLVSPPDDPRARPRRTSPSSAPSWNPSGSSHDAPRSRPMDRGHIRRDHPGSWECSGFCRVRIGRPTLDPQT